MKRKHVQESEKNHKKRHEKEHDRKMKRNESKGTRNRTWTGKGRESEKEHKMRSCHMSQTEPREAMQPRHVWRHLVPTRSCSWCLTICVAPTCFNDEFAIVCYSLHSVCTQCANDYLKYLIWSGDARIVGNAQWYLPVATPSKILEGDQDAFCAANGLWNDKWHVARWQLSLFWIPTAWRGRKEKHEMGGLFLAVCEVLFFFFGAADCSSQSFPVMTTAAPPKSVPRCSETLQYHLRFDQDGLLESSWDIETYFL